MMALRGVLECESEGRKRGKGSGREGRKRAGGEMRAGRRRVDQGQPGKQEVGGWVNGLCTHRAQTQRVRLRAGGRQDPRSIARWINESRESKAGRRRREPEKKQKKNRAANGTTTIRSGVRGSKKGGGAGGGKQQVIAEIGGGGDWQIKGTRRAGWVGEDTKGPRQNG